MRGTRVAMIVVGSLLALVGFALTAGGAVLVWAHATQRDDAGYYTTATERLDTSTYALVADADFGAEPGRRGWVPDHPLGTVRLRASSPAGEVFIGVARTSDVEAWLGGVAREAVRELEYGPFRADSTLLGGEAPDGLPAEQTFWAASTTGPGRQTLRWASDTGRWTAVVMNADGSRNVVVDLSIGARTGVLLPIGIGLGAGGAVLLAGGVVLLVVAVRRHGEAPMAPATPAPLVDGAYPARLDGRLDEPLNRGLWLVKWIAVLPHLVVLAFLWAATGVLTVVAGFAILLTGRYPRSLFDFNVGVLRWTWRVGFYAFNALGTDRYPPFSLRPDPGYPADLDVDFPAQLSRTLVLVKWWLLAIPHYLVVAVLAGGWAGERAPWPAAGGLIAVLSLVAGLVLLLRGRYPKELFDFVVGCNRWVLRVGAYALLLRDEYPPFRLDLGGTDPGSVPVPVEPPVHTPLELP